MKLFHTQLSTECCDDGVATALDAASDESRVPVFDSVRHMFKVRWRQFFTTPGSKSSKNVQVIGFYPGSEEFSE